MVRVISEINRAVKIINTEIAKLIAKKERLMQAKEILERPYKEVLKKGSKKS